MVTLIILAKNEERILPSLIESTDKYINKVLIVDDYSTDNTREVVKAYPKVEIVQAPWELKDVGFAKIRTWAIQQVKTGWILSLDADEIMPEIPFLDNLTRDPDKTIWALPRRKWINYSAGIRDEYNAYPDWQVAFWKADRTYKYTGEAHPKFSGKPVHYAFRGPHIEHLHAENRTTDKAAHRNELYPILAEHQGVAVDRGTALAKNE